MDGDDTKDNDNDDDDQLAKACHHGRQSVFWFDLIWSDMFYDNKRHSPEVLLRMGEILETSHDNRENTKYKKR